MQRMARSVARRTWQAGQLGKEGVRAFKQVEKGHRQSGEVDVARRRQTMQPHEGFQSLSLNNGKLLKIILSRNLLCLLKILPE